MTWVSDKDFYRGKIPKISHVGKESAKAAKRDAFNNDEVLKFVSSPIFTGRASRQQRCVPGRLLVLDEIYWGYLLILLTGMRHSEIGKLRCSDIVQEGREWFIDLTVIEDDGEGGGRTLKTEAAERRIPLDPLLVDLGLIERRDAVMAAGHVRLFPEWPVFKRKDVENYGAHLSKAWNEDRGKIGISRKLVTLYSGRHTRAGWYDAMGLPRRIRDRLMGHAPQSVADSYGPNSLTREERELVESRKLPIEDQVAEILLTARLRAEYGELTLVIPDFTKELRKRRKPRLNIPKKPVGMSRTKAAKPKGRPKKRDPSQ